MQETGMPDQNYRQLFEESPICLWEADLSAVKKFFDGLNAKWSGNVEEYFEHNPVAIKECVRRIRLIDVNKKTVVSCGARDKEEVINNLEGIFLPETYEVFKEELVAFSRGNTSFESECKMQSLAGDKKYVLLRASMAAGYQDTWAKVFISILDITERKLAEDALIISESNYRAVFDTANEAIFVLDIRTGEMIDINRRGCEMHCYSKDEMLALKDVRRLGMGQDPFGDEKMKEYIRKAAAGEPQVFEWIAKDKAGHLFWVEFNLRRAIIGSRYCLLALVRDITERKETEDQLKESELRFRRALYDSPSPIMIHCEDGKVLLVNREWTALSGYTQKDIPTVSEWAKRAYGHRKRMLKADINRLYKLDERVREGERAIITKSGSRRVWDFSSVPIGTLSNGKHLVMSMAIDVTARKAAEEASWESEEHYRTMGDSVPYGVWLSDTNGRFKYISPSFLKLIGLTMDEAEKSGWSKVARPEDAPSLMKKIRRSMKSGKDWEEEFRVEGRDGKYYMILTRGKPIRDEKGRITSWAGINLDVTEREKIEKEIKHLASFPELDPNPVLELTGDGRISFLNKAASDFLKRNRLRKSGRVFLPKDIGDILTVLKRKERRQFYRELEIKKTMFGENIYLAPQLNTVRIYAANISGRKEAERRILRLNRNLFRANNRLKELSLRDSHTGLYNHRYFKEAMEAEFSRAKRQSAPLSLLMIDIDYFKSINDVYGHQFGDVVLRQFARKLKRTVRKYDIVIRFGGEEFIVISPGTDMTQGLAMGKRLLEHVNLSNFGTGKHRIKIRISIGVASCPKDRITKGTDLLDLADRNLNKAKEDGGSRVYSSQDTKATRPVRVPARREYRIEARSLKEKISKLTRRANQSVIEAIFAFAKTIELKDHYTGEHVEKTVHYATEIAKAMNIQKEEFEYIRQAAILHDLGKIGISEKILHKPSRLTKKEFEEIKKHPQIGVDIIRPIQFMHDIIPLMLYHHERWDGKGYPTGLKGEEIPLGARIISIADAYQALTSDRPYRKAYSKKESIAIIKKDRGTHFDPQIVDVFLKILKREKGKIG